MSAAAATSAPARSTRRRVLTALSVFGPGLLAGLSDDDPAGITTYSVLGASHGYQLLWVLLVSTIALVVFHNLAARMGVVTGQGLIGLVRQRYGVRPAAGGLLALVVANLGTTCAEFAGIAAGFELFGISRTIAVPATAILVTGIVLRGSFHRVEHVLMAVAAVFVAYIAAGVRSAPHWGEALTGLVVPTMPATRDAVLIATATLGTTLAPWGLSFIQSYAVDKRLTVDDLRWERVDVVVGAVLTGLIGFFVVVACAATLYERGVAIESAADAARALQPLAGHVASRLFATGLIGAALLAVAILPLSTAYSICEFTGEEAALDDTYPQARTFYVSIIAVAAVSAAAVLVPGAPLISILVLTQVLNAVLLLPLLAFMYGLARDPDLMGEHAATRRESAVYLVTIGLVGVSVVATLAFTLL